MSDVFTKKKRSEVMSRIRGKNTAIELLVFSSLRKRSVYFQRHYDGIRGRPDIALPRKKIAVFIDGDFWHGWKFKTNKRLKSNQYWNDKITNNIRRDTNNRKALRLSGWKVLRVWEHEIEADLNMSVDKIINFITKSRG